MRYCRGMAEGTRDGDEFERIRLRAAHDKNLLLIGHYEEGLVYYRAENEQHMFDLGMLEERLK